MPPSIDDFNSAYVNNYEYGFVACHAGKLFKYSSKQEISKKLYDLYINEYMVSGCNEYEAQLNAIIKLTESYAIDFKEVL